MAKTSDTPAAPADQREKSAKLLPWQKRIARKAAAMKFGSKRIDLEDFATHRREVLKGEYQIHCYLAQLMNQTDRELSERLADEESRDGASELMLEFAKQAKVFGEYQKMFMHGAMRLLCAYARNDLGRDGKPLGRKEAAR